MSDAPTNPLQICGWMQFKHQETGDLRNAPAIAQFSTRPVAWGEKTRMAVKLRSPVADADGSWDEVRHASWAAGLVEEAAKWAPMGFTPNDPTIKPLLLAKIDELLQGNAREIAKKRPAERRCAACRFDNWLPGWATDLVWDPLKDLGQHTAVELSKMAQEGLIPVDLPEVVEHWLSQPAQDAKKRYGSKYPPKNPAPAPVSSPNAKPAQAPARPVDAPPAQAPQPARPSLAPIAPSASPSPNSAAPAVAQRAPAPPLAATRPPIDDEPSPFDDVDPPQPVPQIPKPAAAPAAAIAQPMPAAAPVAPVDVLASPASVGAASPPSIPAPIAAPAPAPTPAAPSPPPAVAASSRPEPAADRQRAASIADSLANSDDSDDKDALARSIFGGSDLPDFKEIAKSTGQSFSPAARPPEPAAAPPSGPASAPSGPGMLDLRFARYPRHGNDGSIAWETALIACANFMPKAAFEACKGRWRATRPNANRKDSLYGVEVLRDLVEAGIPFALEGQQPSSKFTAAPKDGAAPSLDIANFMLSVMAKSSFEPAANIPALARVKFYRDKAADMFAKAAKEPAAEAPAEGWIQLSPGAARPEATMAHPQLGLVRWTKSGKPGQAKLSSAEDRQKFAKLCEAFAVAQSHADLADPAPEGPLAPGSSPIEALPPQGARQEAQGAQGARGGRP